MAYIKKVDEALLTRLEEFHGMLVPGLLIGAYMVEMAYENIGDAEFVDAVAESRKCIVDAVQLMTSCTVGNGWLKVYDWGVFAITLYDKRAKKGVRVYLDTDKIPKESLTYKWFFREIGKSSHPDVVKELLEFKKSVLSFEVVNVNIKKPKRGEIKVCTKCSAPFPSLGEDECKSCSSNDKYYSVSGN